MFNTDHSITEISVTLVKHRTALFKDSARTACNISAIIAGAGKTPAHCLLGLLNYLDSFCRTSWVISSVSVELVSTVIFVR